MLGYLAVVLIRNALMTINVEHLSICYLTSPVSLLWQRVYLNLLPIFYLAVFLLLRFGVHYTVFWIKVLYQIHNFINIFSQTGLSLHSLCL